MAQSRTYRILFSPYFISQAFNISYFLRLLGTGIHHRTKVILEILYYLGYMPAYYAVRDTDLQCLPRSFFLELFFIVTFCKGERVLVWTAGRSLKITERKTRPRTRTCAALAVVADWQDNMVDSYAYESAQQWICFPRDLQYCTAALSVHIFSQSCRFARATVFLNVSLGENRSSWVPVNVDYLPCMRSFFFQVEKIFFQIEKILWSICRQKRPARCR